MLLGGIAGLIAVVIVDCIGVIDGKIGVGLTNGSVSCWLNTGKSSELVSSELRLEIDEGDIGRIVVQCSVLIG
jgi:pseudouridine-5'-phosphate glycosidase